MRTLAVIAVGLLGVTSSFAQTASRVPAEHGDIVITPLLHASAQIEYAGTVIQVDPWSVADLANAKPADLILVTDSPGHHLDPVAIARLRKPGAPVVLSPTAQAAFGDGIALRNGASGTYAGVHVTAVPGYDMTPGEPYHPRGEANGYVITLGGKRLLFAAVGECVPEIQALENIDVAVMPMNLPVDRMRPIPVAECLKTFRPSYVYLNHYDNAHARWLTDARANPPPDLAYTAASIQALREALADTGIELRDVGWYPAH